jgi:hypothetical protein
MTRISALRFKANGMASASCSCFGAVGSVGENRALTCLPASTSARILSLPLLLDAVVASANRCRILGVRYRPYLMMSDLALWRHCSDWLFSGRLLLRKTVPVWRSLSGVDFHIGAQWVETVFAKSRPKAARLSHTTRRIRGPIISFCPPYFSSLGTTSGGSVHLPPVSHIVYNHAPRTGLLSRHKRTSTLWTLFGSSTGVCLRAYRRLCVPGLHAYELKAPRPEFHGQGARSRRARKTSNCPPWSNPDFSF